MAKRSPGARMSEDRAGMPAQRRPPRASGGDLRVKRFLVGTAGHIDHGKTALVKALTGIDADRLPEEKRRDITIDLGFAHAEWDGVRVSFVDVPGPRALRAEHARRRGRDRAVLLVVAADESVHAQTREHFEIVRLLGLSSGIVAVTKSDRAPRELVEVTIPTSASSSRAPFWKTRRSCPSPRRRAKASAPLRSAPRASPREPAAKSASLARSGFRSTARSSFRVSDRS